MESPKCPSRCEFIIPKGKTFINGTKNLIRSFLKETEANPRLEVLIQAESQFIEVEEVNKLKFSREWSKHLTGRNTYH